MASAPFFVALSSCVLLMAGGKETLLDDICMNCICEATSGCDMMSPEAGCNNDTCGLYALPKVYWEDGGRPRVPGEEEEDEDEAYKTCAQDTRCAEAVVHNYMIKYAQDCNHDDDIDCYDYAAIHRKGGFGCRATLDQKYRLSVDRCIQAARNLTAPAP
ncbi:lysozyme-like isoform X2 [Bacillus rossius redtenbacheri]|uniref:lysozyme-like isoform X2 n=1 Tax=Bacillus rossius redtenbacheri TaxID=93214 RepID=UPI002FDD1F9A